MPQWLEPIDVGVLGWFAGQRTPPLDAFFAAVTWAGSLWLIAPATLLLGLLAWQRRQRSAAFLLALGPLVATLASWLLKYAVDRARPDAYAAMVGVPADPSFPSGHTVQATAFALTLLLAWRAAGHTPTPAMMLAAASYVAAVGLSRLYLQVHFPSDVIAGLALGAICTLAIRAALARRIRDGLVPAR